MAKKLKGFTHPEGDIFAGIHTAEGALILDPQLQDGTQESEYRLFSPETKQFVVVSKAEAGSKFRECTVSEVLIVVYGYLRARREDNISKPNSPEARTEQTANDDALSGDTAKCSSCNNSMPVERLAFATYCIDCQREYETTGQSKRKQGEDPNDKIKGTREEVRRTRRRNKFGGFGG